MLACNDDNGFGDGARVEFPVTTGTEYLREALAYRNLGGGELHLEVSFRPCGDGDLDDGEGCEPGVADACGDDVCADDCVCLGVPVDECADAVAVAPPIDVRLAADMATGTALDPKPSCGGQFPVPSSWVKFLAPTGGVVTVDTSDSDHDTVVAVYTGGCGALSQVTCDDDGGTGLASLAELTVSAAVEYTVVVMPYLNIGVASRLRVRIAYQQPE